MTDWRCVCDAAGAQAITASAFCAPAVDEGASPIDRYYAFAEHILTLGDEAALKASPALGRLLLLGLVSGAEGYFRAVLAGVMRICPLSRHAAGGQQLSLGALDYYGPEEVELAVMDRASLAGGGEIRSWTTKLLDLTVKDGTDIGAALREFDYVCHLRHAAVHSQGVLGSGNVRELGLGTSGRHVVGVDFAALQQAGAVCHAAVRAYNLWLFESVVVRWRDSNTLKRVWADDKDLFGRLFSLCRSERDGVGPQDARTGYRLLPFSVRMRR